MKLTTTEPLESTITCRLCGGQHDRRDSYGPKALCSHCLVDLYQERLATVSRAIFKSKEKETSEKVVMVRKNGEK